MQITEIKNSAPVIISNFIHHEQIKNDLLKLIDEFPTYERFVEKDDVISKTDWNVPEEFPRQYHGYIKPLLVDHISELFRNYNSLGIRFGNLWFQQYNADDQHDWHIHGLCHFSSVYFLELPDLNMKTELKDIHGRQIEYDICEGQILTFPSFLYHRSPKNLFNKRKTILSFNINFL